MKTLVPGNQLEITFPVFLITSSQLTPLVISREETRPWPIFSSLETAARFMIGVDRLDLGIKEIASAHHLYQLMKKTKPTHATHVWFGSEMQNACDVSFLYKMTVEDFLSATAEIARNDLRGTEGG